MTAINPQIYQCLAIASALRFYKTTGKQVNSAYTPKNMMSTASRLTGKKFKARDYESASDALTALAEALCNGTAQ